VSSSWELPTFMVLLFAGDRALLVNSGVFVMPGHGFAHGNWYLVGFATF
jgi:hypothetical protein